MKIEEIIQKFITNPKYLGNGAGNLSKKWKCEREDIYKARDEVRKIIHAKEKGELIDVYENKIQEILENKENGTSQIKFLHTKEVLSEDEIWKETKMDDRKWKFVQVYHKKYGRGFLYTANFRLKEENSSEVFQDNFKEFLKEYIPVFKFERKLNIEQVKPKISLILPKQDAHFNKFDIYGNNDILKRFAKVEETTFNIVKQASVSNSIEEIIYIIGSDQFNSEWTSMTTKGTPQQNILTYEAAFTEICNHEVTIICNLLASSDRVKVIFVAGNHDQYVGWHLINWLQTYFRETSHIVFDTSTIARKYLRYNNTAIQLNHGDVLKANDLAHKFPIEFKEEWSKCDYFISLVGDKHHEMSKDIHGIKFYQVPQLSNAKSQWDDKQGHTCAKAEMTAFVITSNNGLSTIYKEII